MGKSMELLNSMTPFMVMVMMQHFATLPPELQEGLLRYMEIDILRELLGRDPTAEEVSYFEGQLFLRSLGQCYRDQQDVYQRIHDLVWKGG